MVMRRGGDSEFKDKMSKKNKELSEYLDEIRVNAVLPLTCFTLQQFKFNFFYIFWFHLNVL